MRCVAKAAHGGVAHVGQHAHYSTGSADHVYNHDAENTTQRRGYDGRVERVACVATDVIVDAWSTGCDGICESFGTNSEHGC